MPPRPLLAAPLAFALTLVTAQAALAGVNAWSAAAADGGAFTTAALLGQRALAGTQNGGLGGALLASADGGASWRRVTSFGYRDVTGVAIDPGAGQPDYATTYTGVFRSLDRGATWAQIAGGTPPDRLFVAVAVDRGRPGVALFARFATAGGGVFRTTTGGRGTWTDVSGGLGANGALQGIVVDPATHVAWGWAYGDGVFVLPDGATTWSAANVGLPNKLVDGLAIDGPGGRVVVATTAGPATLPTTGGPSWTPVPSGLSSTYFLSLGSDASGAVYATSLLGQRSWMLPSGGATWAPVDGGLPGAFTGPMVGDPTVAGHALALTAGGSVPPFYGQGPLWLTVDGATSFTRASTRVGAVRIDDVTADPRQPHVVLAGTQSDGVQRSTDGGATWRPSTSGLPVGSAYRVAFDRRRAGVAYVVTTGAGVYRSADSGATWTHLASAPVNGQALATAAAGTVYVGSGRQIQASSNLGAAWTPLPLTGLPSTFSVASIVPDPDAPGAVYAGGQNAGVFRLAAGASSWQSRSSGLTATLVGEIAFDPRSEAMLAATLDGGVFRSTNRGATWTHSSTGIPETRVPSVVYDPQLANVAYASTRAGVYRSTNGGATWARLGGGIPLPPVEKLRFDADGRTLYAATWALGVVTRTRVVPPARGRAPTLTGTPRQGRVLRGRAGTFTGTAPLQIAYGWQRCNVRGRACRSIPGARTARHRVGAGDSGFRLRFVVTARNAAGVSVALSGASARVRARPSLAARPRLTGLPRVGRRLGVRFTVQAFPAARVAVRWQRCGPRGRGCADIGGATRRRYVLAAADRGHRLRAVVTLRNAFGGTTAASAASAVVR